MAFSPGHRLPLTNSAAPKGKGCGGKNRINTA
jgi:hypothetical protein